MKPMMRPCAWMLTILSLAFCPGARITRADTPTAEASAYISVLSFGAKGDENTDDTAAFQRALIECARQGGGIVYAPAGKYLIKSHLTIPEAVTLQGTWQAPATIMKPERGEGLPLAGTVLLAVAGAGRADGVPFITLRTNATLKGVIIFYPEQTKTNPPIPYPWTVATGPGMTENPAIIDVFMVNPYQAVDFGSYETYRHYVRNLHADVLYRGIYVDRCMDIGRLENVHFAPYWDWSLDTPLRKFVYENGEGFIFGRTDWQIVQNCFAAIFKVGFRFTRHAPAGISRTPADSKFASLPRGNAMITGGGPDLCDTAILVEDSQGHAGISFANCQIFGDLIVRPTNSGMVRFTGCGFFGSMQQATGGVGLAKIDAGLSRVSFSNCHFFALSAHPGKPLIHVVSGRVGIEHCAFMNSTRTFIDFPDAGGVPWIPDQIVLEPGVISALIVGNEFYGELRILNRAKGKVVIAHNLEQTDPPPSTHSAGAEPASP